MKKQIISAVKLMTIAGAAIATSGCATMFGVGNSEFGCDGGANSGVRCMSARDVYELTNNASEVKASDFKEGEYAPVIAHSDAYLDLIRSIENEGALPLRTDPKVMRVWIAPWVSQQGDFIDGSLVFTELEGRKWTMGIDESTTDGTLTPLQKF